MKIPQIKLRPHHFLCLQGYKGYNYSSGQVGVWDKVAGILREKPGTVIRITSGKDSLCQTCPAAKNMSSHFFTCIEKNIKELDNKIKKILGLKTGENVRYSTIVKTMKERISSQKHEELCSRCFWWQKGLCRDSFSPKN